MHWLTQSGLTESVEAMPMTLFVIGLAQSLALADRAPRYEFGICMLSWCMYVYIYIYIYIYIYTVFYNFNCLLLS